jgi:pSer/pThr/pTyr-binding forkhead associated (FHA) protein
MADEQLRVIEGKERGKSLDVAAELLIGRSSPNADGRLGDDPEISRRHAHISRGADGRLTIEDLGSANGTFVNDERIDGPRPLEPGEIVRFGKTVLQVTDASGALPPPPPPEAPPTEKRSLPAEAVEAEPAEAAAELVVIADDAPERRLTVGDELMIGREVSGEGRLSDDQRLSRRHARVARDARGRLTIEDLGSANGTFVNGERISGRHLLKAGDKVLLGSTTLGVVEAAPARPGPVDVPARAAPAPPVPEPAREPTPPPPEPPPAAREPTPPPPEPRPEPAPPAPPVPAPVRARTPRPAPPKTPTPAQVELMPELPLGSVFAGCRVEELIGYGDMGVVYGAEELALQRRVALKLILPEFSRDERFRERFRRESRVAAAIDHQNVIPIFDAGDEDGVLYITMRLVEGTDLRELIAAERPLEPLRAARIVRQVGAALDAAHSRGMVHRDVKPSNVLLGREDHVYLSDFGLAKEESSVSGLTRQGSIVARAEYVAPEQIMNERVDARADIYALGCLLYEALTGEPPFAHWNKGPQVLAHVEAPPPSPVEARPDLPRQFDDVVQRAMAKAPSDRYPSAGDLGQAALVAAGGLRKASPWSMVATGEAAPLAAGAGAVAGARAGAGAGAGASAPADARVAAAAADQPADAAVAAAAPPDGSPDRARADRAELFRWTVAIAGLVIVAVGMVAALHGISTL